MSEAFWSLAQGPTLPSALFSRSFTAPPSGTVKLRPDMRMVATRNWSKVEARLSGARDLAQALAGIAANAPAQAAQ